MTFSASPMVHASLAIALCSHLRGRSGAIDVDALLRDVRAAIPDACVEEIDDLCELRRVPGPADGLVLGLCQDLERTSQGDARFREAGYDPLGVRPVNLIGLCGRITDGDVATRKALLVIAGAVARVQAFDGSRPAQLRPRIGRREGRMSRRSLFRLPAVRYQPVATVSAERCQADLGCDLCVGVCPAGALTASGSRLRLDPAKCEACGLCAAACPQGAIDLPAPSRRQVEAEVAALVRTPAPGLADRTIVFACSHGLTGLSRQFEDDPAGGTVWLPVEVPSTGAVSVAWLLGALAAGASAAVVLRCPGGCTDEPAEALAGKVAFCKELLDRLGHGPERVALLDAAVAGPPAETTAQRHHVSRNGLCGEAVFHFGGVDATVRAILALAEEASPQQPVRVFGPASPCGMVLIEPNACTLCGRCAQLCPTNALEMSRRDDAIALTFDPARCVACGLCTSQCAEDGAIRVERVTDVAELTAGRRELVAAPEARCVSCGAPVAPVVLLQRIAALVGDDGASGAALMREISQRCPACRGMGAAGPSVAPALSWRQGKPRP